LSVTLAAWPRVRWLKNSTFKLNLDSSNGIRYESQS
jgi:hypothetical protein